MKKHVRSVLSNPNTGVYCHWYMVDKKTFQKAVEGLAIPQYTHAGIDRSASYLRACDDGGFECAAIHIFKADQHFVLEYSNQALAA